MILLPAIDLIGGRCVRLSQGDFTREVAYQSDPVEALAEFRAGGATEVHIVDLDGARAREPRQHELLAGLAREAGMHLQVAGGFRSADHVIRMFDAGIARVVLGSLALDDPDGFVKLLDRFGNDRLVLALDVRLEGGTPRVATHGWSTDSGVTLEAVLARFPEARHLLVTDIARDGMLAGPNVALMQSICGRHPGIALQASGGVASLGDLSDLRRTGAARAIVGKAIWEGRFTVAEGLCHARG
jgi:phosphoribosylformimino-5-aminoimidazole carboxamide ribotide isomerase